MSLEFEMPKNKTSILKVIGVGGGGSNAVNHMYNQEISEVEFIVCNTDQQALDSSPVPLKVQLGESLSAGLGAGAKPEVGRNAAVESIDGLRDVLAQDTKMLFITAGLGGGTGTGAAPVIAEVAKELGILTVGIVTLPFAFEGPKRRSVAIDGLEELKSSVDAIIVIKNDKLREICGNLSMTNAFHKSDDVLTTAAKGIVDIIFSIGYVNVDFNDVITAMTESGVAIMGSAEAEGEGRAQRAVDMALESPLLNDNDIRGARHILLNIKFGEEEITMDELEEITAYIKDAAGEDAELLWGYGHDDSMGSEIRVTVIATGFEENQPDAAYDGERVPQKTYKYLDESRPEPMTPPADARPISQPLESPVGSPSQPVMPEEEPTSMDEPFLKRKMEDDEIIDQPIAEDLGLSFQEMGLDQSTPSETESHKELDTASEPKPEKQYFQLFDDTQEQDVFSESPIEPVESVDTESVQMEERTMEEVRENRISLKEHRRNTELRLQRIKDHSMKLRTPSGLSELEKEPAYKRMNMEMKEIPHSSESEMSRFTLNENEKDGITLSKNNPFLDKNVD